jgi:hypothetical protein
MPRVADDTARDEVTTFRKAHTLKEACAPKYTTLSLSPPRLKRPRIAILRCFVAGVKREPPQFPTPSVPLAISCNPRIQA